MVRIPPMKHVYQYFSATPQNISAITIQDLAIGTLNPDPYTSVGNQVRPGSIIKAITLQIDVAISDGATHHDGFEWYIWFNVNGAQTVPDPQAVNTSHLKNQVIHQDGCVFDYTVLTAIGVVPPNTAKWRLVINLPKWAQQVNQGDKISIVYRNTVNAAVADLRITAIYKEIFP